MNCSINQLAVVIDAEIPDNIGKFVHIVGIQGYVYWSDFEEPLFMWVVESLNQDSPLIYCVDGNIVTKSQGIVPDIFLRPIRPSNQGADKNAEYLVAN